RENRIARFDVAQLVIDARYHLQGSEWRVGEFKHAVGRGAHGFEVARHQMVLWLDHPRGVRVAFQLRYATLLCVARQVVPQLENLNAIARNQRFEFPDRLSELLYICLFAWFFVQQSEQGRIPGAKYNAGAALCRQVLPIAPKERKLSFLLAGRPERQGADMSRIHPLVDQIHGGTLAGTIDARHNDQQAALWILQARILR